MKKIPFFDIALWTAIVLWCVMIFSLSGENGSASGGRSEKICRFVAETFISDFDEMSLSEQNKTVDGMQFFVRKTAHFSAYAALGLMLFAAFRKKTKGKAFCLAVIISAAYAASDELHQLFVAGRSGRLADVLLDTCGAAFGGLVALLLISAVRKIKAKRR